MIKRVYEMVQDSRRRFDCRDCRGWASAYCVHDTLWAQAWPNYAADKKKALKDGSAHLLLCFACLAKRLDRPLTIDDFTDAPVNEAVRFGYNLAAEVCRKSMFLWSRG